MIVANKSVQLVAKAMMIYLIDKHRAESPKILRGDRFLTGEVFELSEQAKHKHKAVHTVISFHPNEKITQEQKEKLLDDFEKTFFGNMKDRVNYIAVEHNEKDHYHIHIYINKYDLKTGKSYNPFPPGHIGELKNFSAVKNAEFGFKQVEKTRLSTYSKNEHLGMANERNGFKKLDKKVSIDKSLQKLVKDGKIKDRGELIHYLKSQGYEIPRIGTDYISVAQKDGQNIRFKGGIYSEENSYKELLSNEPKPFNLQKKIQQVNTDLMRKGQYNTERYGAKEQKTVFNSLKNKQIAQNASKQPTSDFKQNGTQHMDSEPKASQNAIKEEDNQANIEKNVDLSTNEAGTEHLSAQEAVNSARLALVNARTPEARARAEQRLAAATANLNRLLAQLEEQKNRKWRMS